VRAILAAAVLGLTAFVVAQAFTAYTASATVSATQLGRTSAGVTPDDLKPSECTIAVTSIVSGSGNVSASAGSQLVLGSSANDTISGNIAGNDCIVGGAGTDTVTGLGSGNQCIVSSTTTAVLDCTIVARRP
jgi:Ca2+-binding RTX toxin-like protein